MWLEEMKKASSRSWMTAIPTTQLLTKGCNPPPGHARDTCCQWLEQWQ